MNGYRDASKPERVSGRKSFEFLSSFVDGLFACRTIDQVISTGLNQSELIRMDLYRFEWVSTDFNQFALI